MNKFGIIGFPLGHTLSPAMHKAALNYYGIEGDYIPMETDPEDLIDRIKQLKIENFKGFNVTIPHKVFVVPLLSSVDDIANIVGAVNTIVIDNNKALHGYNTDIYGFIHAIPENLRENLKSKKAAVLGVGGAARAVAIGLIQIGICDLVFYARNEEKALILADILSHKFPDISITVKGFNEYADLSEYSIVVNTTPLGMKGDYYNVSPLNRRAVQSLKNDAIVYDLIYKPKVTKLLKYAKDRELITIDGIEMLVLQGAKAFEIWTGKEAPVDIMREAVIKSL